MKDEFHYIIRGGDSGVERLHVLSRAMRPGTLAVLDRAGLGPGLEVLDLGCGNGEATIDIARLVGPTGRVVGIDMDDRELAHARAAADAFGLSSGSKPSPKILTTRTLSISFTLDLFCLIFAIRPPRCDGCGGPSVDRAE